MLNISVERTDLSFLVPEKLACVLYDLLVSELRVRLLFTEIKYFPQGHTKGPYITSCGELPLHRTKTSLKLIKGNIAVFSVKPKLLPAGCSPRTSSVWAGQLCPGCGSSPHCIGFGSCQNQLFLWCSSFPPSNFVWLGLDEQSSRTTDTSSLMLSE